jgi:hypothetical protein
MTFYPFNTNVPNAPDNAADDQPDMLTNTKSTNNIFLDDHFTFEDSSNNGGYHKYATLFNITLPIAPNIGGSGILFALNSKNDSWPTWTNSLGKSVTFLEGRSNVKDVGYAYLPGGMLMQWGVITNVNITFDPLKFPSSTQDFPITFGDNAFNVFLQPTVKGVFNSSSRINTRITSLNNSSFKYTFSTENSTLSNIYWTAIGIA